MLERNANFDNFPLDIIVKIFSYLPPENLLQIALTNKRFNFAYKLLTKKANANLNSDVRSIDTFSTLSSHSFSSDSFSDDENNKGNIIAQVGIASTNPFDLLAVEVLEIIFLYCTPETLANFSMVNKEYNVLANTIWKYKFFMHFPHYVNAENDIDWRNEFINAYLKDYEKLPQDKRNLFSLVKENFVEKLKTITLSYDDLKLVDNNGIGLLQWARLNNCQAVLDYIYQQVVLRHYAMLRAAFCEPMQEYLSSLPNNTIFMPMITPEHVDPDSYAVIHWAVLCVQNAKVIENLFARSFAADTKTSSGLTPLLLAAQIGNVTLMRILIDYGANISEINNDGENALHLAVQNGHYEAMLFLLSKGINIDTPTTKLNTVLMIAAEAGYLNFVQYLVGQGANINASNVNGFTPLILASRFGHFTTLAFLLQQGANPLWTNEYGNNALHVAAEYGYFEIAQLLIAQQQVNVDLGNNTGATPLLFAACSGHIKICKLLLLHGANLEVAVEGMTALHFATQYGHVQVVRSLLANGANTEVCDARNNYTPLLVATVKGYTEIVIELLNHNAVLEAKDVDGMTSLMMAAYCGWADIAKILLEKGANIEEKQNGCTALRIAVEEGHTNVVNILLEKKADLNIICSRSKKTLLMIAIENNHHEIVKSLVKHGAKMTSTFRGDPLLIRAIRFGSFETVKALLELGADINGCNDCGATPLIIAVSENNLKIVNLLLSYNANLHAKTRKYIGDILPGNTALHVATARRYVAIIRALLQKDTSNTILEAKNMFFETPIMTAKKGTKYKTQLKLIHYINKVSRDGKLYDSSHTLFSITFGYNDKQKLAAALDLKRVFIDGEQISLKQHEDVLKNDKDLKKLYRHLQR